MELNTELANGGYRRQDQSTNDNHRFFPGENYSKPSDDHMINFGAILAQAAQGTGTSTNDCPSGQSSTTMKHDDTIRSYDNIIINDHMIRSHDDKNIDHYDHMNDTNDHSMRSYDNMITLNYQHHDQDGAKSTNNNDYEDGCRYTMVGTTATLTTT